MRLVLVLAWAYVIQKTESLWGSVLFHAGSIGIHPSWVVPPMARSVQCVPVAEESARSGKGFPGRRSKEGRPMAIRK